MDFVEGVGESSSPPRTFCGFSNYDVRNDVYSRLVETSPDQAMSNPEIREQLETHFYRLPPSYGHDVNIDRAEDLLLHQSFLALARDPAKHPIYHIRFLKNISTRIDDEDQQIVSTLSSPGPSSYALSGGAVSSHKRRTRDLATEFESWLKLENLNLDVRKNSKDLTDNHEHSSVPIHEIIFSTVDKPKLLIQVHHKNVVRFIGACTKGPHLCIVTEYMPGGTLYDYLHRNHNVMEVSQLLKFAIDVCKGVEYLHRNNIIHRI